MPRIPVCSICDVTPNKFNPLVEKTIFAEYHIHIILKRECDVRYMFKTICISVALLQISTFVAQKLCIDHLVILLWSLMVLAA